jgi:diguanylate cyclase
VAANLETSLRGPGAYDLAASALAEMQRLKVWPTPINFEIWLRIAADPTGALATEVRAMTSRGETITEAASEDLFSRFVPRGQMDEDLRDTGRHLDVQLGVVAKAISSARRTSADYGRTLASASEALVADAGEVAVRRVVETLGAATREIQIHNIALEKQLGESTQEVSRLRQHLETVERDAMTDGLSGLTNRKAFDKGLAGAVAAAEASGEPLSLAIVDIDHFTRFNDTWGHQTGDQVIRFVASVLKKHGAAPRVAARYGGEEFALVLPGLTAKAAVAVLDAVRLEVSSRRLKRRSTDEELGAIKVSAGVAERVAAEPATALVARADAALYDSKRSGRDRVSIAAAPTCAEAA